MRRLLRCGVFVMSLGAVGMLGCSSGSTAPATTQQPTIKAPTANAGGPYTGVAGTAVTVNGSGSSDPQAQTLTYAWSFGDGGTGTGVGPTHTYTSAGTFTVSLTVTNTSGLTGTASATATITAAALPDFGLLANPQSVAIAASGVEVVNLLATGLNGFTSSVTVKLTGLPAGVTADASSYTLKPGIVTQATLTATSTVASAIATMTATGTSGTLSHASPVVLSAGTPVDYVIALSGVGVSLTAGTSQTLNVTATAENGFTGTVSGSIIGLPAGVTASPASFALPVGTAVPVTLTAAATGVAVGTTFATVNSSSGTTTHTLSMVVNYEAGAQDFVVATPAAISVAANGSVTFNVQTGSVNGFAGPITVTVTGQPTNVGGGGTATISLSPNAGSTNTIVLTGKSGLTFGTSYLTITSVSGSITHVNKILITTQPSTTEIATVNTNTPGSAIPQYFVGLSLPESTLIGLTGTGTTPFMSFTSILQDLAPYIGSPNLRVPIGSILSQQTEVNTALTGVLKAATFTENGVTTSPQLYMGIPASYVPAVIATGVQTILSTYGSNVMGFEMDNEPDLNVSNGYRPVGWTYSDYMEEVQSYQTTLAPYVTAPKFVATAAAGADWDVMNPALKAQMNGQVVQFTEHDYGTTSCNNTPTVDTLLMDRYTHNYLARYGAAAQTWSPVPVRVGEMNSVACLGYAGVSNVFAASLWVVDAAFEAAAAGTVGFNIHTNGNPATGPALYDLFYGGGDGKLAVYPPFYGVLFFSEAIQNRAALVPVTINQSTGNIKVWATQDAIGTLRVIVLEKDTDGLANQKTIQLNLGSYTKTGIVTTMTAPSVSALSGISIAGQTFDGTDNGKLAGTATSSGTVSLVGGVYTLTVSDGTATMLTVPQ